MANKEESKLTTILTEEEKWECTVRWLNNLYLAYADEVSPSWTCERCPIWDKKCKHNTRNIRGITCTEPPQKNFAVLEQFTGKGTVIGELLNNGGIL